MIRRGAVSIRTADVDDAPFLAAAYARPDVQAATLDARSEPLAPTKDELVEVLSKRETLHSAGTFYAVEDSTGLVGAFTSVRRWNPDTLNAEAQLLAVDPAVFENGLAREALGFIAERAFARLHMRKLIVHCLPSERALAELLAELGYAKAGIQREVLFARGCWHDVTTYVLDPAAA